MQPGRERRLAAEASDLSEKLNEDFLRQVFRFDHVAGHPQTERVTAPIVPLIKLLEGFHVAFGGLLRQLVIGRSRFLSVSSSHSFARAHILLSLNYRSTHDSFRQNDLLEGAGFSIRSSNSD